MGVVPLHTYAPHVGLPPPATLTHWPLALHESHAPPHADAQHTPSTQLPSAHWEAPVHPWPSPSLGTQAEPLQKKPPAQLASLVQLGGHAGDVPEQTYGEQLGAPAPTAFKHCPLLLQASQGPPHAPSQQTPSAQKPDVHSLPTPHPVPSVFFAAQLVPLQ